MKIHFRIAVYCTTEGCFRKPVSGSKAQLIPSCSQINDHGIICFSLRRRAPVILLIWDRALLKLHGRGVGDGGEGRPAFHRWYCTAVVGDLAAIIAIITHQQDMNILGLIQTYWGRDPEGRLTYLFSYLGRKLIFSTGACYQDTGGLGQASPIHIVAGDVQLSSNDTPWPRVSGARVLVIGRLPGFQQKPFIHTCYTLQALSASKSDQHISSHFYPLYMTISGLQIHFRKTDYEQNYIFHKGNQLDNEQWPLNWQTW